MARATGMPIALSVLDRLSDTGARPVTHAASVRALKESIRRHLEDLLNTRRAPAAEFEGYEQAHCSVVNYGLDELTSLVPSANDGAKQVQQAVERCLDDFEPRLRNVSVEVLRGELTKREVRLRIEATIPVSPSAEAVSFDTMLDLTSGMYSVG